MKYTTYLLTLLLLVLVNLSASAQAPYWNWANKYGIYDYQKAYGVVPTADGNFVTLGIHHNALTLGSITLPLVGSQYYIYDMFLCKYDNTGKILWAKDVVKCITRPTCINLFQTSTGDFMVTGIGEIGTFRGGDTIPHYGGSAFVAKFTSSGSLSWARVFIAGTLNFSQYFRSYFVAGMDGDNLILEGISRGAEKDVLSTTGGYDTVLMVPKGKATLWFSRYDTSGNLTKFSVVAHGGQYIVPTNVTADKNGDFYLAGNYEASAPPASQFVVGVGGDTVVLPNTGNNYWIEAGTYLMKLNHNSLKRVWQQNITNLTGGSQFETMQFASDTSLIITGVISTSRTTTFGFAPDTISLTPKGYNGSFIASLDTMGHARWAKIAGSAINFIAMATDAASNLYFCGSYTSTADFGAGKDSIKAPNTDNLFVAEYDSVGKIKWMRDGGSGQRDFDTTQILTGLTLDPLGNIYVVGSIALPANPNALNLFSKSASITIKIYSTGQSDFFLGRLGSYSVATATTDIYTHNNFNLYPNPTAQYINITAENELQNATVKVYNLTGQLQLQSTAPFTKSYNLDISSLSAGAYLVEVTDNNNRFVQMVVKQ